jgi:hypothetical protein
MPSQIEAAAIASLRGLVTESHPRATWAVCSRSQDWGAVAVSGNSGKATPAETSVGFAQALHGQAGGRGSAWGDAEPVGKSEVVAPSPGRVPLRSSGRGAREGTVFKRFGSSVAVAFCRGIAGSVCSEPAKPTA